MQSHYGQVDDELYKKDNLNLNVDPISGVAPLPYAKIQKSTSQRLAIRSYMNCTEFAVIAFWELQKDDDTFKCIHFFIVPNPQKRMV